jgi:hypothetical protein
LGKAGAETLAQKTDGKTARQAKAGRNNQNSEARMQAPRLNCDNENGGRRNEDKRLD